MFSSESSKNHSPSDSQKGITDSAGERSEISTAIQKEYPTENINPDSWKQDRRRELKRDELMAHYANLGKKISPQPGQGFLVVVYLLSSPTSQSKDSSNISPQSNSCQSEKDISGKNPIEGIHGIMFPVCVTSTFNQAKKKAKKICQKYGIDVCRIYPMAEWRPIAEKAPANFVKYTPSEETIGLYQRKHHQRKIEAFQQEVKIRDAIQEEHLKADQPGTLEHYSYCWYRAVKTKARIEVLEEELATLREGYQKEVMAIQKDFQKDPILDKKWLPILKKKLVQRDEANTYNAIHTGYNELRDSILPPKI